MLGIGAISVFGELQNALDRIWRAPARPGRGVWALVRARLLSFGMVLGIGFLLIVSLAASAAVSALGKFWQPLFGAWGLVAELLNLVISFALVTVTFAMIYKIIPRVRIGWRDVWVGAAVTALLFAIGKSLIGIYLGRSGFASGFGAAGSLIVVLVWMYYSAQIFLLGAEFTKVYARTRGTHCPAEATPKGGSAAEPQASPRPRSSEAARRWPLRCAGAPASPEARRPVPPRCTDMLVALIAGARDAHLGSTRQA